MTIFVGEKRHRFYSIDRIEMMRSMFIAGSHIEDVAEALSTPERPVTRAAVYAACARYGVNEKYLSKRRRRLKRQAVSLPRCYPRIDEIFIAEAQRRGMRLATLGRLIIEAVIRDNLFSAILDP